MIRRKAIEKLNEWAIRSNRKPLILRGARQVGKTTLVDIFAKQFDNYLYLNLEKRDNLNLFENNYSVEKLIEAVFYLKGKTKNVGKTLLFIDEIQNSQEAVKQLRYFYEEMPDLYVIAAGSLLETLIDKTISFPVGRVSYLPIRPLNFLEFLTAMGEDTSVELLKQTSPPEFAHNKLMDLFNQYTLIGGMPEIVSNYVKYKDINRLQPIYDELLTTYVDDVEKYSTNTTFTDIIRHTIHHSFLEAGSRIKFQGFGNSNYRSREMGEAFRTLEKTMLLQLVYPVTSTKIPIQANHKKSPKLQLLDTGLVNYSAGIQKELFLSKNIESTYKGKIAEHVVGQELKSLSNSVRYKLNFWTRESKNANSEVDFVYKHNDLLIPIEVKSGATGRLRSLHQFVDRSPHNIAIRAYSGKYSVETSKTIAGKEFTLINLPFYMLQGVENIL